MKGVIEIATPARNTRLHIAPSIYLPVPKKTISKKSFYYSGSTLWNSLPYETRFCNTVDDFKTKLYNEM